MGRRRLQKFLASPAVSRLAAEMERKMNKHLVLTITLAALGCSSGPSRVKPPSIDADGAASDAMELYDKDGDGSLAGAELDAAVGVKAAMATVDTNKDGKVSEDEIASRIRAWQATTYGIMPLGVTFTMDGQPLAEATITFEPEPFLGEDIKAGVGETTLGGSVLPSVPVEERASKDTPDGLALGLYRIRVSKMVDGKETIPAKYNTETTLGQEVAMDDPAVASQRVRYDLKSK
jgi:hypothetical protein